MMNVVINAKINGKMTAIFNVLMKQKEQLQD